MIRKWVEIRTFASYTKNKSLGASRLELLALLLFLGLLLLLLIRPWIPFYKGDKEGLWNKLARLEASMKLWESLVEPRHT
ncbi:hypothetical protein Tco_0980613 [Tanacetum coccineum]